MKKALFYITTIGSSFLCSPVFSQNGTPDSLGLPGDNLNLYAVLDIFQKSETLEGFEKSLNTENSKVNNLDLNNDDKTDYIQVIDNVKGSAHAIVLQVAVNQKEKQDVAVIEVDKDGDGNVKIQIIGDEMLYGKNYIIEPKQETDKKRMSSTPNPGYTGGTQVTNVTNNYYNDNTTNYNNGGYGYDYWYPASSWAIVRYMYYPSYTVYVSPWSWGYYPWYWNPWRPLFWHSYYYGCIHPYYNHYYGWYYRSNNIYSNTAHSYYGQRRSTSTTVSQRRNSGEYKNTYSRPDLAQKEMSRAPSTNGRMGESNSARPARNTPSNKEMGTASAPARTLGQSQKGNGYSEPTKVNASSSKGNSYSEPAKVNASSSHANPGYSEPAKVSTSPSHANPGYSEPAKVNASPSKADAPSHMGSTSPARSNKHSGGGNYQSSKPTQSVAPQRHSSSTPHMSSGSGGGNRSFGGGGSGGGHSSGGGGRSSGGGGGRR